MVSRNWKFWPFGLLGLSGVFLLWGCSNSTRRAEADFVDFIGHYEQELSPLEKSIQEARWQYAVSGTEDVLNVLDSLVGERQAMMHDKRAFGYLREFRFEEEDGNTAVDSINGADAVINGSQVERTEGVSGRGLAFDGVGNYVNAGDIVSTMNEYSISGWFRPESVEGNQTLIGQQRDSYDGWRWNLYVEDGVLKFEINNGKGSYPGVDSQDEIAVELNSGSALAEAGQWNQFAVVRNGDTFALYLNGVKAAEETKAGIDQTGTPYASWFGGYNNNAGGEPTAQFRGVMDEIVFYNTPITDEKVKDLYDKFADTEPVSKNTLEYFLNSAKEYVANGDVDSCVESVRKLFAKPFCLLPSRSRSISSAMALYVSSSLRRSVNSLSNSMKSSSSVIPVSAGGV